VARLLLELGPQTAAGLADRLGLSAAAVRRHLDVLLERGLIREVQPRAAVRGRGRPAKVYALTDAGRADFPHAYDDLASTALRFLRASGGAGALESFAAFRTGELERRLRRDMVNPVQTADSPQDPPSGDPSSPDRLARALTAEGYAASAARTANGVQLCQHHCPVAHVAAEFGQLCEAETRMFERLLGTHVQRLATIAHGDGVCTTFIPDPKPAPRLAAAAPIAARPQAGAGPDSPAESQHHPNQHHPNQHHPNQHHPNQQPPHHNPHRDIQHTHQNVSEPDQPSHGRPAVTARPGGNR
jgi:predicted ArsR family transcriptional regulator